MSVYKIIARYIFASKRPRENAQKAIKITNSRMFLIIHELYSYFLYLHSCINNVLVWMAR